MRSSVRSRPAPPKFHRSFGSAQDFRRGLPLVFDEDELTPATRLKFDPKRSNQSSPRLGSVQFRSESTDVVKPPFWPLRPTTVRIWPALNDNELLSMNANFCPACVNITS